MDSICKNLFGGSQGDTPLNSGEVSTNFNPQGLGVYRDHRDT